MHLRVWSAKMRLRVISARNEIPNLNPNEKTVHLAFRASNVDFLNLMQMLEGDVWGHRKDLDEYFTVEDTTLEEIRALAAGGASADDVANQIQRKARIGSELIKYIAKTKITA
jgi:hypothetical protein